jgi:uncharacterized protein with PIN domain
MKFIVDGMLGKLAKWLKVLGFDAFFSPKADDNEILAIARQEGRTILSRDRAMLARARGAPNLLIQSERWPDQVRQVLDHFDLHKDVRPYSRCLACNAELKLLSKAQAANLVPLSVLAHADDFALCPSCGRVYWPGTHFDDMAAKLGEIVKKPL